MVCESILNKDLIQNKTEDWNRAQEAIESTRITITNDGFFIFC